jgi:ribosome-associated translation inhibitor RaiA
MPVAVPRSAKRSTGRTSTAKTPLNVRAEGVSIGDRISEYVHRRVGFKLGKFARHVTRVTVRFEDLSGPKGAKTYACRFKVVLPRHGSVVLESRDGDIKAAFDVAVDATERAMARLVGKSRAR